MGIIVSHYRDERWFNLSTEPGPCDVSHFVLNLDQGFVVMLNVDPLAMTSVTLVPHRDKKKGNFVMQPLLWQHGYVSSWTTKVASVDLNEVVSKLAC